MPSGTATEATRRSGCASATRSMRRSATVEVEDEGEGFDRSSVPDPLAPENLERSSGRGLLLMRHYLTWMGYNARGNCVRLCKCRSVS